MVRKTYTRASAAATAASLVLAGNMLVSSGSDKEREASAEGFPGIRIQELYIDERMALTPEQWDVITSESEMLAYKAAERDLESPEVVKPFVESHGHKWSDWKRNCKECDWMRSDEAKRIYRAAERFGVEEVAYGLPEKESDMRHFDEQGRVIESEDGAIGKLQVLGKVGKARNGKKRTKGGFDEVWHIYNKPLPHQKLFSQKYKEELEYYRSWFTGKKGKVWKRLERDEKANEVAGFIYLGFLKHKYGDIDLALEMYFAGESGRKRFPNNARWYRKAVMKRQAHYDSLSDRVCPRIASLKENLRERQVDRHYKAIFNSNINLRNYASVKR